EAFGYPLILSHNGAQKYGGPLFWAHYSYVGLNPKGLKDQYADYWELNRNHTLINRAWCVENEHGYEGYGEDLWGLTASYTVEGYNAHHPENDLGVITPTAALSSFPYTPEESMAVLKNLYYNHGEKVFGRYGFYDALSLEREYCPERYLAIDQGPVVAMIENHRTGLGWRLFMQAPEIQEGLKKLGFETNPSAMRILISFVLRFSSFFFQSRAQDRIMRLVILPDTQSYLESCPEIMESQFKWLAEQASDIDYVLHVGDITQDNTHAEWVLASIYFDLINDKIPYAFSLGNHDFGSSPGKFADVRDSQLANKYFPLEKLKSNAPIEGAFEAGMVDN